MQIANKIYKNKSIDANTGSIPKQNNYINKLRSKTTTTIKNKTAQIRKKQENRMKSIKMTLI